MQVSIKNIEENVFREFKAESIRRGLKIGNALSLAMKLWIDKNERKPKISFLELKPKEWGKGTEKISEEIDKILY